MKIVKEIINNARAKNQAHETKYACKNITTKNTIEQYYIPIGNKSIQILIGDAFDYNADNRLVKICTTARSLKNN